MGAAATWALSRTLPNPQRCLLLEQFEIGHTRGSSHGGSRIFRFTHAEVEEAALMPLMLESWRALEGDAGESLLSLCGGLYIGNLEQDPYLQSCVASLNRLGMPFELWGPRELAVHYPQFRLREGESALFQPQSGVVAASPSVAAMVRVAQARGVGVRTGHRVTSVEPLSEGFAVHGETQAGERFSIRAERVILTAGPWAPAFLRALLPQWPPFPLEVTHQQVAYYRAVEPSSWGVEAAPIFIFTADPHVYGFPIYERPGYIKVARELIGSTVDPDAERAPLQWATDELTATVQSRLVGVESEAVEVTPCLYTETPNRDFIIDRHPEHDGLIIAAGFSGRGFKFAAGMGELLAGLAITDAAPATSPLWLPRWAIDRFAQPAANGDGPQAELFPRPSTNG
jgi:sarcosine oxidase